MNATLLARRTLTHLLEQGLEHVVVCPGSRNAPLSLASFAAAQAGMLQLHTRIDERAGAFLALGIAKASGKPAAVITTSGSAITHLHAAMLEAAHAGVRLVALTADRPAHLRGTDANQTTDQVGVFAPLIPTHDLDVEAAEGELPPLPPTGPVHWNLQFAVPLTPGDDWELPVIESVLLPPEPEPAAHELTLGPRTVVIAGDSAGKPAQLLAETAGWPLLAEPTSGARVGANAIRTYRLLLDGELAAQIQRVVVYGHPTLSRPVTRLLQRPEVQVVATPAPGVWARRSFPVEVTASHFRAAGVDDPAWLTRWQEADETLGGQVDALVASQTELTPYEVAAVVGQRLPADGLLVVGASHPIRDLDLMLDPGRVNPHQVLAANRGLAGIDGTISTALGMMIGRDGGGRRPGWCYLGDVTFLHDLTSLILGPEEQRPPLQLIVANDDGGSIFSTLEQGAPQYAAAFEKVFATPHGAHLASLCHAFGIDHVLVQAREELEAALQLSPNRLRLIEVRLRRDNRRELDQRLQQLGQP